MGTGVRTQFRSFAEFYPYYLSEHQHPVCRRLHFAGSLIVLALLIASFVLARPMLILWTPVAGYGLAWIGHFAFEHNRPATFRHPLYSFMGDWVMFRDMLLGKIPL
ncbi:DUF962 domain-containing protein [Hahella sp. SMD15-11]|uniref:DUF962 domain-containing protein n=1 Tax=Thermohahella caldifontis TaxID=3142973 RepID=A0AB39UZ60_9GAMM